MIIHIAQKHFEQGLLNELLSEGWAEGEQTCPVCDETLFDIMTKTDPKGWESICSWKVFSRNKARFLGIWKL